MCRVCRDADIVLDVRICVNKQTGMDSSLRQGIVTGGLVMSAMSRRDFVLLLAQRLRRWPHFRPTLVQYLVFKTETVIALQTQDIAVSTCWISAGPV